MPVSKKRKPKKRTGGSRINQSSQNNNPNTLASKSGVVPKKKLSRQKIAIYVISILMILSLAIGFLAGNSQPSVPPTPIPQITTTSPGTSAPASQSTQEESQTTPETTSEPTTEN